MSVRVRRGRVALDRRGPLLAGSLVDPFTTADTGRWSFGAGASVSGGNLVLTNQGSYAATRTATVSACSLVGSRAGVGPVVYNTTEGNEFYFTFGSAAGVNDSSNQVQFIISGPNIFARIRLANGTTSDASVAYDPTGMAWLQFREAGGNLLWEYAATEAGLQSGASVLRSVATPFSLASGVVQLFSVNWVGASATTNTVGGVNPGGPYLPAVVETAMPTATTLAADAQAPAGWTRVLAEDFNTDVAEPNFPTAYPHIGTYPADWNNSVGTSLYGGGTTLSVSGGVSRQRVHTDGNGDHRTETLIPTATENMSYGRFKVRWRVQNPLPGYKVAWLLWPVSETWPRDGEIDFPEGGLESSGAIEAYMHRQDATLGSDQDGYNSGVPVVGDWHVTEIIWAPGFCRFVLDGVTVGTSTSRVPNTPMGWRIQTEGNLNGSPADTGIDPATTGYVEIDWLVAYSRNS